MTIGIGVLCSSKPRPSEPRPDTVILVADTMGSTETDSSELHKVYVDDKQNFFAVCAGRIEMAAEFVSVFNEKLAAQPQRTHGNILTALQSAIYEHRTRHFFWDVINAKYMCVPGQLLESHKDRLTEDWQSYDPGLHAIVGTFNDAGVAHLYSVGPHYDAHGTITGLVDFHAYPGIWTIGSGAYNANFWLNFRGQHLGVHPKQSAYHAYEAKIMAAKAPTVNSSLEMIVASKEKFFLLTEEQPCADGCPVSIPELRKMFKKFGPQNTNILGHAKRPMFRR